MMEIEEGSPVQLATLGKLMLEVLQPLLVIVVRDCEFVSVELLFVALVLALLCEEGGCEEEVDAVGASVALWSLIIVLPELLVISVELLALTMFSMAVGLVGEEALVQAVVEVREVLVLEE